MAKTEQKTEPKKLNFNPKDFLPEGMDPQELIQVGGLRPIAAADLTENAPVAGWVLAELDMPPRLSIDRDKRAKGIKEPWQAFLVELTKPTKAYVGEEIVDVEVGKKVLIPLNGSLKNNDDLRAAAQNPRSMTWALFMVVGQVQLDNQRNPMWDYEVSIHPKVKARTDGYIAYLQSKKAAAQLPAGNASGQVIDKDGKTVQSLVG